MASVEGWDFEENVPTFLGHLGSYLQTSFDDVSYRYLVPAIEGTDARAGKWFEYRIDGWPPVGAGLAYEQTLQSKSRSVSTRAIT